MRTGETKTEAIRKALEQRAATLGRGTYEQKAERIEQVVREIGLKRYDGSTEPLSQQEQHEILGFGPDGF